MHRIIYSVIFYLALPVILIRLLIRSLKVPAYRKRIGERFALQPMPQGFDKNKLTLWVHAVSVGETVASAPLVAELRHLYPDAQIVMTTMTPTGSDRVRMLFGESVMHVYIPYDLPGACNRFLDKYRPSLLILMETELWPNLVHSCHQRGVKLLLANGRLSEKSAAAYGRFATFTRNLLEKIDRIAAQAAPDEQRFIDLGAKPGQIEVTGSLKFLIDVNEREKQAYFSAIENTKRPVLVAASTREGEDEKVLVAFKKCLAEIPSLLLVLIPRHPERFARASKLSEDEGFTTVKRSDGGVVEPNIQVVIGDSMGEMLDYYSIATIAFVGGSLVDTGCQNVLEPAALGIPILVGPSQYNFATICKQLEHAGALKTVKNELELAESFSTLIADVQARQEMGERGKQLVRENQNALPALMKLVVPLIQKA
ncbi:MAG: 3-deoxy-D-manno-octulosonic acid transferase [SAR86 cluster bacterium]|uniref:3-deoxy-D-manno-octulosonic acid transferase n=1 Tax=SAR86 cluster bacterium TaxID=2030880 RepID=A0A2A4WXY3_9GAMM|nr:MAG: 3-deoxy-D-manno-octulosonic acid transferase [SAR86 cluster bacterium]